MNPDKWQQIKEMVRDKFEIQKEVKEELDKGEGEREVIEFKGPLGLIRLEYIEKPRILDKKTHYSRRIGGDVKVDYVYSDTEKVYEMKAYLWHDDGDWREIQGSQLEALANSS